MRTCPAPDSARAGVTLKNNHLINSLDQVPPSVLKNAGLESDYRDILTATFARASAPEPPSRVAASGGDGFVFGPATVEAAAAAIDRILAAWQDKPRWMALQQAAMASDFSWEPSALRYLELYRGLRPHTQ